MKNNKPYMQLNEDVLRFIFADMPFGCFLFLNINYKVYVAWLINMTILLCGTKTDFLSRARECVVNQRKEAHDSCTNQPDTTLALSAGSLWT